MKISLLKILKDKEVAAYQWTSFKLVMLYWPYPVPILFVFVGKVWKPKEEEKVQINEDEATETEWDDVLKQATEEELVDLAGKTGILSLTKDSG